MADKKKPNIVIDIDKVIEARNAANPELRELTREALAKDLDMNKQVFSDWKGGRAPQIIEKLLHFQEISGLQLKDFITVTN